MHHASNRTYGKISVTFPRCGGIFGGSGANGSFDAVDAIPSTESDILPSVGDAVSSMLDTYKLALHILTILFTLTMVFLAIIGTAMTAFTPGAKSIGEVIHHEGKDTTTKIAP